jgi:squalene-hopene/tetraprenyl-beta-curcumene cyclase
MKPLLTLVAALLLLVAVAPAFVAAQQPSTLNDVQEGLPEVTADEPKAGQFSSEMAANYLDLSALNWQKTTKCAT